MISLEVRSWDTAAAPATLTRSQAAEVEATGLVEVRARPGIDGWTLVAREYVGAATGTGWDLRVTPRIDVARLFFLLAYAADPGGWRDLHVPFEREHDLVSSLANGFAWHAWRAVERGPLRGYVEIDDRLTALRGRVRFGDQIARSATLPLPVEVSYSDYTPDIVENRLLRTAAAALLRLPRIPDTARRRLRQVIGALSDVALLDRPREATAPMITRLNKHYEPALRLAAMILRNSSIRTARGAWLATGFVFDMNRVFEDFVTTAFSEAMRRHGGEVGAQVTERSLDLGGRLALRPDITWWRDRACAAILDAKYKPTTGARIRHPDAYQMLAYCTAYGLPRGYLIYADESGSATTTHIVRGAGVAITDVRLGIGLEPADLLRQIDGLADEVARGAALPITP